MRSVNGLLFSQPDMLFNKQFLGSPRSAVLLKGFSKDVTRNPVNAGKCLVGFEIVFLEGLSHRVRDLKREGWSYHRCQTLGWVSKPKVQLVFFHAVQALVASCKVSIKMYRDLHPLTTARRSHFACYTLVHVRHSNGTWTIPRYISYKNMRILWTCRKLEGNLATFNHRSLVWRNRGFVICRFHVNPVVSCNPLWSATSFLAFHVWVCDFFGRGPVATESPNARNAEVLDVLLSILCWCFAQECLRTKDCRFRVTRDEWSELMVGTWWELVCQVIREEGRCSARFSSQNGLILKTSTLFFWVLLG